jgi:hypothetical protein
MIRLHYWKRASSQPIYFCSQRQRCVQSCVFLFSSHSCLIRYLELCFFRCWHHWSSSQWMQLCESLLFKSLLIMRLSFIRPNKLGCYIYSNWSNVAWWFRLKFDDMLWKHLTKLSMIKNLTLYLRFDFQVFMCYPSWQTVIQNTYCKTQKIITKHTFWWINLHSWPWREKIPHARSAHIFYLSRRTKSLPNLICSLIYPIWIVLVVVSLKWLNYL